jgi:hypothetical protein
VQKQERVLGAIVALVSRRPSLGTNRTCAGCQLDVPNQISEQAYDFEIP